MALLKEDNAFTHVIAIDFGTGASGYIISNIVTQLRLKTQTRTARFVSKCSVHAMAAMTKKHQQLYCLITMAISWISVQMRSKNTRRSSKTATMLCCSRM